MSDLSLSLNVVVVCHGTDHDNSKKDNLLAKLYNDYLKWDNNNIRIHVPGYNSPDWKNTWVNVAKKKGTWVSRYFATLELQIMITGFEFKWGELVGAKIPKQIVLIGWSRGGINCMILAKILSDKYKKTPIKLFLLDPCWGPSWDKTLEKYCDVSHLHSKSEVCQIFAMERNYGLSKPYPPHPARKCKVKKSVGFMPGEHGTLVNSKSDKKTYGYVYDITRSLLLYQCKRWKVKLSDEIKQTSLPNAYKMNTIKLFKIRRYTKHKKSTEKILHSNIQGIYKILMAQPKTILNYVETKWHLRALKKFDNNFLNLLVQTESSINIANLAYYIVKNFTRLKLFDSTIKIYFNNLGTKYKKYSNIHMPFPKLPKKK